MRITAVRASRACARRRPHRLIVPLAAAVLLLRTGAVQAAAFLPGPNEADPPTGDTATAPAAAEPVRNGNGIRWEFAPWRTAGTVSLDGRWLRLEDGSTTRQALVFNDIEFASHLWQPWFVQVRAGLGVLAARDRSQGIGAEPVTSDSGSLTGRLTVSVFPQSRFPFELRADVGDSRVQGDTLGSDFRSYRLSLTQSYRPETGNDSYQFGFDHSRLSGSDGASDTVDALRATALFQRAEHTVELGANWTLNDRSDTGDRSRIAQLSLRHGFHPSGALNVDTLASWNELQLRSDLAALDSSSDIRQISSFATWRPREGDWLYAADAPLYLTGSARLVDAGTRAGGVDDRAQAINVSLGVSQELGRHWRLSGAVSGSVVDSDAAPRSGSVAGNAAATWTGEPLNLGEWRYSPSVGGNVGLTRASAAGERRTLGLQGSHGLARSITLGEGESLALNLTQSVGVLAESRTAGTTRALAHSGSVFWQSAGLGATQSFAGLSLSDSRTFATESGHFRLVNLQFSRRTQLSRHASWSGNLTLQATRSDATQLDAFTGTLREQDPGWQRYGSGTLSYEHQRAFGVPRLRFTTLLAVNSAQLERRAEGDIDAPRERVTESLETRLDYAIGRLEARASARLARVDGRAVSSVFVRVQRRY